MGGVTQAEHKRAVRKLAGMTPEQKVAWARGHGVKMHTVESIVTSHTSVPQELVAYGAALHVVTLALGFPEKGV